MSLVYVIGSLRNPAVPDVANQLREAGQLVFDDWFAAGEYADDEWQAYEIQRQHSFREALDGIAAKHVFDFDRRWLDTCKVGVLVMPAGKSAHLELGYMIGQGKRGYILMEKEPDRFDVMYKFAEVVYSVEELVEKLRGQ